MLRHTLELLGVVIFAATGVLSAGRKRMDLLGVAVIALVTALGGGTIRDLLLGRSPVFWIRDVTYLWAALLATGATLVYIRLHAPPVNVLLIGDALGLALFTIGGTQIAESCGQGGVVAVMMGAITGAAGGLLRDVLSAEVPLILRPSKLYASAAIAGAVFYLCLKDLGMDPHLAGLGGMLVVALMRIAAIYWSIRLPMAPLPSGDGPPAP